MGLAFDASDGLVPYYECREACLFANYNWSEWIDLEPIDRASAIAHYRVHNLVESHISDAVEQERKRQERRNAIRRRGR